MARDEGGAMQKKLKVILSRRQKETVEESPPPGNLPPVPAGVLIPMYQKDGEYFIIFTLRTQMVEHHKGQISFPGGAYHPGDENLLDTALRESFEEIGLFPSDVEVVGELDDLITGTNFRVAPFVGFIPYPYTFHPSKEEVAEIIHAPLSLLLDERYCRREARPGGGIGYFYDCRGYVIWGVTARILKPFLDIIVAGGLASPPRTAS
ncbi:MAG: CoA pyrophosphatase [Chloroflexi bacterium]|nr:CoA pyrophosphatase [Chloroflexota bacterium]